MRRLNITLLLLFVFTLMLHADEGMWMPSLLSEQTLQDMKKAGFTLSAKDIYDINQACLKDAVLGMAHSDNPGAFYGTASFVSDKGLVITNHHLALGLIQEYSTPENNYIRDGFLAQSTSEELPANNLTLARLVRIEDVTEIIKEGFDGLTQGEQNNLLNQRGRALSEQHNENGRYFVSIKSYFSGNQYFMEVYQLYNNVKLVAVPPLAIAKFGGNEDNWQWPRQAADFAFLRVYNESINLPVRPITHLSIATGGVDEGDFTMLMGFPGNTRLFLTAEAIRQLAGVTNYHSVKIRREKINLIEEAMEADENIWVKYSDIHARSSNHLLRWEAENDGIRRLGLYERKKAFEESFPERLDQETADAFNKTLRAITDIVIQLDHIEKAHAYVMEAGIQGAELTAYVALFDKLGAMATRYTDRVSQDELNAETRRLRQRTAGFFEAFDFELEQRLLEMLIKLYDQNLPDDYKTSAVREEIAKHDNYTDYIQSIFSRSIFQSQESIIHFLDHFTLEDGQRLEQDPVFQLCLGFYLVNRDRVFQPRMQLRSEYATYHKEFVRLISEHADGKIFPDANRSLRVSFGTAKGFTRNEEVHAHSTNLAQMLEKNYTGKREYALPDDFLTLLHATDNASQIPACFINDSHTTGGSSGSPVLNAKGKLVGIGFDRVSHGLVSDFEYFPEYSRNIAVDIDFVLFILDKYMGAGRLIKELSFVPGDE
jgi:hypothetical protein